MDYVLHEWDIVSMSLSSSYHGLMSSSTLKSILVQIVLLRNYPNILQCTYLTKYHQNIFLYPSLHCLNCSVAGLFHKAIEIL